MQAASPSHQGPHAHAGNTIKSRVHRLTIATSTTVLLKVRQVSTSEERYREADSAALTSDLCHRYGSALEAFCWHRNHKVDIAIKLVSALGLSDTIRYDTITGLCSNCHSSVRGSRFDVGLLEPLVTCDS